MTTILPRRHLIHSTLQPIHRSMTPRRRRFAAQLHAPNIRSVCAEYRGSAALLRDLGQTAAADLLETTADAFEASARAKETPSARTIAAHLAKMNEDYEETTVVADLPLPEAK